MALLSVEEAHARLMALMAPLGPEPVPLAEAAGRVLAADVVAARAQPPFAVSAMDGYALRAAEAIPGARLPVRGEAAAGRRATEDVAPGTAARIFTGAPVPGGADAVLIQENADREADRIRIRDGVAPGQNIRPAGADFAAGARVTAPRRLTPREIALLAAMNAGEVAVARRPRVAVIATGDELVMPGEVPGEDQIVAANSFGLKAMLEADGALVSLLPIAGDDAGLLATVLALTAGADLIVTIGGASIGDHDVIATDGQALGLDLVFHKVAMRPGKPLLAGRFGTVPLVGLPGNPVSALVCAELFLRPAVARLLGLPGEMPVRLRGRLGDAVGPNGPRAHFMRARVSAGAGGWICTALPHQDSALLSVLADADALLVRPPDDAARQAGDSVEFLWLG